MIIFSTSYAKVQPVGVFCNFTHTSCEDRYTTLMVILVADL